MKVLAALLLPLLVVSCSLSGDEAPPEKAAPRTKLVGRVASLPADGGYALIETYGAWDVPAGGLLSGVGPDGRTAALTASGEKLERFAAADIRSGTLEIGDPVYYRPLKEKEESPATGEAAVSATEKPDSSKKEPESSTNP